MKERFDVTGMTCSACSSHVEKSVGKLTGVENVSVNLLTNSMQVEFDENKLDTAGIIKAVEDAGYGAAVKDEHAKSGAKTSGQSDSQENSGLSAVEQNVKNMKKRLIVSLIFWIPLMYVSMGHMIYQWLNIPMPPFTMNFLHGNENAITYAFTQFLLLLPILIANQKYFKNGFKTLWHRSPNMDSLIAIGAGAAILYGIFAIYRIGYAMGNEKLIKYINDVKYSFNSYTMNQTALALGVEAIKDKAYFEETRQRVIATREWTKQELTKLGFSFGDSMSNFIFATHERVPAKELFEALKKEHIFVRYFSKERISNYLRISIGTKEEMEELIRFLKNYLQ